MEHSAEILANMFTYPVGFFGNQDINFALTYPTLLMHFNEFVTDWSLTPHAITTFASIDTSVKVFEQASCKFVRASNHYFSYPDSPDWEWSSDFTFEVRFLTDDNTLKQAILNQGAFSSDEAIRIEYDGVGNLLNFSVFDSGAVEKKASLSWTPTNDTFYALAFVRNGDDLNIYIDGTDSATVSLTAFTVRPSTGRLIIGWQGIVSDYMSGNMDELIITPSAKYSGASYTVPVVQGGRYGQLIYPPVLLLPMNANFNDISKSAHTVTEFGSPVIDTTDKVLGAGSGDFDDTSQKLTIADSADFDFNSDFTVEHHFAWRDKSEVKYLFCQFDADLSSNSAIIIHFIAGSPLLRFSVINNAGTLDNLDYSFDPTLNQFYALAWVREGDDMTIYVDGVRGATKNISGFTVNNSSDPIFIANCDAQPQFADGNIDELVLTPFAKYSGASYTVPTQELDKEGDFI